MNEPSDVENRDERVRRYTLDLLRLVAREVVRRLANRVDESELTQADRKQIKGR